MSAADKNRVSRRCFVCQAGVLTGTAMLGGIVPARLSSAFESSAEPLPRRILGRTGESITIFTLGTAPCGNSRSVEEIAEIVNAAIDLGVTSIDTAPAYVRAEEGVGKVMKTRRKEVFLATKVPADTAEEGERSLAKSLRLLQTDYVDLLYYHSVGNRNVKVAFDPEGAFSWLVKQKKAGKCRYIGISGHNLPGRFAPFLNTGEVDVLLVVVNFVDRHTYAFEEQVLPVARKHNVGIIAMKVLGGADPAKGSYGNPQSVARLASARPDRVEAAIRYALSVPGVTSVNLGVNSVKQLKQDLEYFHRFQPLSDSEMAKLLEEGREVAAAWGPHFGPVAEEQTG
ncbi:MAG: aldo/keto reductase [Thermogutta sp.]